MEHHKYPCMTRSLAKAAQIDDLLHDLPFLFPLGKIRGITVRQLTPRMCGLLLFVRSPFMYRGATRRPQDVAQFLWIVSPKYREDQKSADRFMKNLPLIPATREGKLFPVFTMFCRAIDRYLDHAFIDEPATSPGSATVFPVAYQPAIIHPIALAYNWEAERVLDLPIAQLYQFLKLIRRDRAAMAGEIMPPAFGSTYQDKVRRRIVLKWHRRAHALGVTVEEAVELHNRRSAA